MSGSESQKATINVWTWLGWMAGQSLIATPVMMVGALLYYNYDHCIVTAHLVVLTV